MTTIVAGPENLGLAAEIIDPERVNTLHYYPFSLYSIIVRFAIELGRTSSPGTSPNVALRLINLKEGENLTEEYLALNAKGQVPVLDIGTDVLTESLDILHWLSRNQPALMPEEHKEDILAQLGAFYGFHAQPLAAKSEALSWGIPNKALEMLEDPEISDAYRRSLEIRSIFHDSTYGGSLNPENVEDVKLKAQFFIEAVARMLAREERRGGSFIFGNEPTVLDAVATAFLSRLSDVGHTALVQDPNVWDYHQRTTDTEAWKQTMNGRKTIWQPSDGPAEKWCPL